MEPRVGELERNVARSVELASQAATNGADLVVLPELTSSGYVFASREEAWELSEEVPGGPAVSAWAELCARTGLHLVAGVCERSGRALYNSAVVVGPDGHVGTFRKVHLWDAENLWFEPGDLGFPVFETPLGRLATFICYDLWFPESTRSCAIAGAEIVCVPTNWVPIPGQAPDAPAIATVLCQANAHSNAVFVAAADRVGTERGQPFIGQSVIVSYTGWPIAGPASHDREEILYADVDLADPARTARWNRFNQPLENVRPEAYRSVTSM
jgi:predicted amidohydrolase